MPKAVGGWETNERFGVLVKAFFGLSVGNNPIQSVGLLSGNEAVNHSQSRWQDYEFLKSCLLKLSNQRTTTFQCLPNHDSLRCFGLFQSGTSLGTGLLHTSQRNLRK